MSESPLQEVEGERVRLEWHEGRIVILRRDSRETVGSVEVEPEGPVLFARALCIEEELRGYGLGSEAAHLIRRAAESAGFAALRAWAPPDRGLAVYFWFRMGLRPLHGEGPEGGIWMERPLIAGGR